MNKSTKLLVYTAVLTAFATIANIYTIPINGGGNFISLVYIPCFFAGIFLGPVLGFGVGVMADVLGMLINPLGPWLPLVTLASGLIGFMPGVIFKYVGIKSDLVKLFISIALCLIVCTCGLNTLATFLAYSKGKTFWAYLAVRIPTQLLVAGINFALIGALIKVKPLVRMMRFAKGDKA